MPIFTEKKRERHGGRGRATKGGEREREKKLRGGGRVMERVATGEEGGKSRSRAPRREERSLRERAREKGEGERERGREEMHSPDVPLY